MAEPDFDMNGSLRAAFPGDQSGEPKSLQELDRIISEVFPKRHQRKSARIIWDVCDASNKVFSADEVADRLAYLVNEGIYAGYGNLERWAFSEIGPAKQND